MKITGKVEVEGIVLDINIEAPDDATELYVTNVSKEHITIPKERMLISHLGLNENTVRHLEGLNIHNLGQLLENGWDLKPLNNIPQAAQWDIDRALQEVRRTAVIFEPVALQADASIQAPTEPSRKPPEMTISQSGQLARKVLADREVLPQVITLESPFSSLGFTAKLVRAIQRKYGAINVKELIALGHTRLIMTTGVTSHDINLIERRLETFGYKLGFPDKPIADMEDVDSESKDAATAQTDDVPKE